MDYKQYTAGADIKTEIVFKPIKEFTAELKKRRGGGVAAVCAEYDGEVVGAIAKAMAAEGFIVKRYNSSEDDGKLAFCEVVQFAVAVGGSRLCCRARQTAAVVGAAVIVVPTAMDGEGFLSPETGMLTEGKVCYCPPPELVYIDSTILNAEGTAAGYGRALFTALRLIDGRYEALLSGGRLPSLAENLLKDITQFLNGDFHLDGLTDILLKIGLALNKIALPYNAFAEAATACGERSLGENSFLAAYTTLKLYSFFLKESRIDTLLPPDITKSYKLLEKICGIGYNESLKRLDIPSERALMKDAYVLREYRADLLTDVESINLTSATRNWRRLYPDAGYWVKGYMTAAKLLRLLSLSAELSGGLVKSFKRGGALENYI